MEFLLKSFKENEQEHLLELNLSDNHPIINEIIEGTMINLFYSSNEKGGAWEIATKSTVGGNVVFYAPKNPKDTVEIRDKDTFRNMFFELGGIWLTPPPLFVNLN